MSTRERCMESLSFCHLQEESHWAAARIIVQQDIDEFVREAGPAMEDRQRALTALMQDFDRRFPDESDPVLIRSYMRRQLRRIGYSLQHGEEDAVEAGRAPESSESPATAPETEPGDEAAVRTGQRAPLIPE